MKTLGSIVTYRKGKPPKTGPHGRLPVLSPHYLRTGEIEEMAEPTAKDVVLNGGELILLWDGSNAGEFFRARAGVLSSTMVAFDFDEELTNRDYLYYDLKRFEPELKGRTAGSGIPHVDKEVLLSRSVFEGGPLEQAAAAKVLLKVDHAIEQTEALLAKQQRIKTGLMHDLLTRGLDSQGQLRDPLTHEFKSSGFGPIPDEWDVRELAACTKETITYGIVQAGPHVQGGIPYIRTGDMSGDKLVRDQMLCTSPEIAARFKRSEVRAGEIVCAIRATIGKVLQVPPELDGANLTQGTARISPAADVDAAFLLWALRSMNTQNELQLQSKGTTFAEITLTDLRRAPVAIPRSTDEQHRIGVILNQHDVTVRAQVAQLTKLRRLKSGLMHDLLTGDMSVTPLIPATL
ncbi:restriction endonuclease subunit S [Coraliomargarita parva]|uniref:restriction endonuclease subunit S n=1 Tax=Coraliomargarita parva TaxID=3014050 RepID=UPI0022B52481|nr:restriction endonuclease subunit S [Coraliomargarita parva]